MLTTASIPMRFVGPINITSAYINGTICVPLATFESPLWPSVARGAKVSRQITCGINVEIIRDVMTRSIVLEANSAKRAHEVINIVKSQLDELQKLVATTSLFACLESVHSDIVGNLIYLRFSMQTGDASGHNMVTKAAEALCNELLEQFPDLRYISLSANLCTDKKVSAVNAILGRGKQVVAEITIPREVCQTVLRTTPEKIVELNTKKNLLGSILAGSLRSANAHFANILLALYLATGQDAANIVEGSQGIVHAEVNNDALYFSVNLPNLIVGTVGNGKDLPFVKENLAALGADVPKEPGYNAKRLAAIIGATVLCGELSLLAALTNQGELMKSHQLMEREKKVVEACK